jgi:tetratricopeptide (TPR) repeat protein
VGPGTRLVLWCRRNPALAGLQLTVALGSLAISLNWHLAEQRRAAAVAAQEIANQRLIAAENARNEAKSEAEESSRVLNLLLNELGDALNDFGRYDQAESLFRELLRMPLNRDLIAASIRLQLGRCLIGLKRFDEAESVLTAAQQRLAVARGERPLHERLRSQARKLFVGLYEAWGKPAEAARWRDKPPDGTPHPNADP